MSWGATAARNNIADLIEKHLQGQHILYEREKVLPVSFDGERKGKNKVDFAIDDRVVFEVKAKTFLEKSDYFQLMRYLDSCGKRLGVLVNFRQKHLTPKRVISGYEQPLSIISLSVNQCISVYPYYPSVIHTFSVVLV